MNFELLLDILVFFRYIFYFSFTALMVHSSKRVVRFLLNFSVSLFLSQLYFVSAKPTSGRISVFTINTITNQNLNMSLNGRWRSRESSLESPLALNFYTTSVPFTVAFYAVFETKIR